MTKKQPKDKFEFDVFISYSSKDKQWVRGELLNRIEKAGLKAFIDFRDFARGAPSIKECERGVVQCRKTLIVLTPDYIESEWCELEAIMTQTLGPANRDAEAEIDSRESVHPLAEYAALFDPQTSGGLLIAVSSERLDTLRAEIQCTRIW